ncbi:MAG: hypothetical protein QOK20_1009 [Acidimicrobiaceae bacterium]|nr:hypothetical protein [Acidimicrobiaceae bacterium]
MAKDDEAKLAELMLYVAHKTQSDRRGGAVKLNKYLYFADFAAVRRLGRPITGVDYQKLTHGPAPRRLLPVRDTLVADGSARLERRQDAFGYEHTNLIPLRDANLSRFSADEIRIINEVVEELLPLNGSQVSDLSHREAGWVMVNVGDTIPYELALVAPPEEIEVTAAMASRASYLIEQYADHMA